jgi:hypothetical protein
LSSAGHLALTQGMPRMVLNACQQLASPILIDQEVMVICSSTQLPDNDIAVTENMLLIQLAAGSMASE